MKEIRITSNRKEMVEEGRVLWKKRRIFTKQQEEATKATISRLMPSSNNEERGAAFFQFYYDYWVYGFNIDQEFYLHIFDKTHEEKSSYLTYLSKFLYFARLNKREEMHILEDKYEAYQLLSKYYKRDIIKIESEKDYTVFLEFISKHPIFVVKPLDLSLALGVRKINSNNFRDKHELFLSLLNSTGDFNDDLTVKWSNLSAMVLEELIEQDNNLAKLHPGSVNGVRVTTVRVNGQIHIYHPWIKVGVHNSFIASAALGGFDAGIDAETGVINTDGFLEDGSSIEYHPDTKVKIKGYQIEKWDELICLAKQVASELQPSINYVGWDFVLTPLGWVVMEGNFYGDTMWQMFHQKGFKEEFEILIGWKPEKKFWWQYNVSDLEL